MFDILKTLIFDKAENEEVEAFAGGELSLAQAALMFHVIKADGIVTDTERARMKQILDQEYELGEEQLDMLYASAKQADSEAVDLYRFTSLLKHNFNHEQCILIIENLWEMVFADGVMHELEDHVVWRIAKLLDVETSERIALKQRVKQRLAQ